MKTPDIDELLASHSSRKPESHRDVPLALRNGSFKVFSSVSRCGLICFVSNVSKEQQERYVSAAARRGKLTLKHGKAAYGGRSADG